MTASVAHEPIDRHELVRLALRPAPRWSVPLALAYRERDHDDPTIKAIRRSLASA